MEIPVFQSGKWIRYKVPSDIPLWSTAQKLQAASFYAAAIHKGQSARDAANLAECYINKQLYKDLQYKQTIEDLLQSILV